MNRHSYQFPKPTVQALAVKRDANLEALLKSAEMTADAWGDVVCIVVTRSDGRSCGGQLYVTREPDVRAFGLENVVLVKVYPS